MKAFRWSWKNILLVYPSGLVGWCIGGLLQHGRIDMSGYAPFFCFGALTLTYFFYNWIDDYEENKNVET